MFALFTRVRYPTANTLHWLLTEPLIHGARLDINNTTTPGLMGLLIQSGTLTLRQACSGAQVLDSLLGLNSS